MSNNQHDRDNNKADPQARVRLIADLEARLRAHQEQITVLQECLQQLESAREASHRIIAEMLDELSRWKR